METGEIHVKTLSFSAYVIIAVPIPVKVTSVPQPNTTSLIIGTQTPPPAKLLPDTQAGVIEAGGLKFVIIVIIALCAGGIFLLCPAVGWYVRRYTKKDNKTEFAFGTSNSEALPPLGSKKVGVKVSMKTLDSSRVQESHPKSVYPASFMASLDRRHADGRKVAPSSDGSAGSKVRDTSSDPTDRRSHSDMDEEEPDMEELPRRPIANSYISEMLAGAVGKLGAGVKTTVPRYQQPAASEADTSLIWNVSGRPGVIEPVSVSLTSDLIVMSPYTEAEGFLDESEPQMGPPNQSMKNDIRALDASRVVLKSAPEAYNWEEDGDTNIEPVPISADFLHSQQRNKSASKEAKLDEIDYVGLSYSSNGKGIQELSASHDHTGEQPVAKKSRRFFGKVFSSKKMPADGVDPKHDLRSMTEEPLISPQSPSGSTKSSEAVDRGELMLQRKRGGGEVLTHENNSTLKHNEYEGSQKEAHQNVTRQTDAAPGAGEKPAVPKRRSFYGKTLSFWKKPLQADEAHEGAHRHGIASEEPAPPPPTRIRSPARKDDSTYLAKQGQPIDSDEAAGVCITRQTASQGWLAGPREAVTLTRPSLAKPLDVDFGEAEPGMVGLMPSQHATVQKDKLRNPLVLLDSTEWEESEPSAEQIDFADDFDEHEPELNF